MNSANNYPSCIKIPATVSPKYNSVISPKDVKTLLAINYELISVANRVFGFTKWSHSVSHQTLDFTESFLGKFLCGCCSYVKIQLDSGVFHEDMGYYIAEASTKPLAIQAARTGSVTNAFEKVLICFGSKAENEVKQVLKKYKNSKITAESKKENTAIGELNVEKFEPCAQSTPYLGARSAEKEETSGIVIAQGPSKLSPTLPTESPLKSNRGTHHILLSDITDEIMNADVHNTPVVTVTLKSNQEEVLRTTAHKEVIRTTNEEEVTKKYNQEECLDKKNSGNDQKKVLSEEELLRRERRRKQMEKQAEYKRIMKERELQKIRENEVQNRKV